MAARFLALSRRCNIDSSQLTTEQAAKINDAISPTVGYLCRLVRRMGEWPDEPGAKARAGV